MEKKVADLSANERKLTESYQLVVETMGVNKFFGLGPLAGKSKFSAIFFVCATLTASVFALKNRFHSLGERSPIVGRMALGQPLFEALFSLYCFVYFSFFAKDCKKDLIDAMNKLELSVNVRFKENFHWLKPRIIIILIEFLALYIYTFYISITNNRFNILIILSAQFIAVNCTLQICVYYLVITNWLRNKYDNFNSMIVSICEKPYSKFDEKIDNIIDYLEKSSTVVKLNNKLFGTSIFTSNCLFIYIILYTTVSLFDGREREDSTLNTLKCIFPIPFVLYLIVLAMACDAVEKSGKRVIKTCYLFVEELKDAAKKEQLRLLARYAEQWCPVFSAAGFYDINQSCLTSIFSAILTYFVIIIQFNMVLSDQ
uniref:Gustatory receptor n=1 Tax=Pyrrhalta aenescens TaxID=281545 RepID=A0A1J0KKS7_9CUCU|nr:gustatory receptor 3 [Pyrrhalta aenescens]